MSGSDTTSSTHPLIDLQGVGKDYQSGSITVTALNDVDLQVAAGEFLALHGPSGSGKSTLLNIVGCLDRPTRGTYRLKERDVSTLSRSGLSRVRRESLGFIFQSYNLVPVLTAFENVEFPLLLDRTLGKSERTDRVAAALRDVGLADLMHRRPAELSGGQQQRVAVARALVKEPLLVLADEPTANLDSETGQSLLASMRDLNRNRGVTFLFSTHDPQVMAQARRLVRLQDGRITDDVRTNGAPATPAAEPAT